MTRLAKVVREFAALMGWDDEVLEDDEKGTSRLSKTAVVDGQPCRLYVDTNDEVDAIAVFFYAPFRVKPAKYAEACMLVNAINHMTRHGRLEIDPDDGEVRYASSANVEFCEPGAGFIRGMTDFGAALLEYWMWALSAVAMTERTARDILDEEASREEDDDATPDDDGETGPVVLH